MGEVASGEEGRVAFTAAIEIEGGRRACVMAD